MGQALDRLSYPPGRALNRLSYLPGVHWTG